MKVAVIQSNYIPWRGYFDVLHEADVFVFYDDVQYTVNDWRNRNRIATANGVTWLTIPVGNQNARRICDVEIRDRGWARKHWMTIEQSYRRAPGFALYGGVFKSLYAQTWESLSVLNQALVKTIARDLLGVRTEIRDSREFELSGTRGDRLLTLLQQLGTTDYISGPAASSYLDVDAFARAGVRVHWKDYNYPAYPQIHGPHLMDLSIVDVLMNCGDRASDYIWGHRSAPVSAATASRDDRAGGDR